MDTKTFGERLAHARLMRAWSQTDLGKAAGMAATQVSRYEAGRATPRGLTLGRLAASLGVRPEWLVTGLGDIESGRPPSEVPSSKEKLVEFSIMLSDEERRLLEAAAASEGLTLAQFIRMAMSDAAHAIEGLNDSERAAGIRPSIETLEQELDEQRKRLDEMAAVLQTVVPAAKSGDAHLPAPTSKRGQGFSVDLPALPENMRGERAEPKKKA